MLQQIVIQNFVFIENSILDFHSGMNVVTGETGAGKSIFLGALSVTLGEKCSPELIQPGKTFLKVTSLFDLTGLDELQKKIKDLGFTLEDQQLSLRREIDLEGKSKCFVNDQMTRLGVLKEIGSELIDLHGQHDNQVLFQASRHTLYYDRFLNNQLQKSAFQNSYAELFKLTQQLEEMKLQETEIHKEKDFLDFTIKELKNKLISPIEYDSLKEKIRNEVSKEKISRLLQEADSTCDTLVEGLRHLRTLVVELSKQNQSYDQLLTKVEDLNSLFSDLHSELGNQFSEDGGSKIDIDEIQERLAKTESLKKKYGLTLEDLRKKLAAAEEKLAFLETVTFERGILEKKINQVSLDTYALALKLRETRKAGLAAFENALKAELEFLAMKGSRVSLTMDEHTSGIEIHSEGKTFFLGENGLDKIEFVYSPSREQAFRKLKEIASGGEMSRLMLTFKKVLGSSIPAHTLVFDEIDTGIGGATALNVGKKMKEIASQRQLVVITHLPQIAKYADQHFQVVRAIEDAGRTHTRIHALDEASKIKEIARMLSGSNHGQNDLAYAKEFLEKNN